MCDKNSDEFIKKLIYKNKVVIFGLSHDELSEKSNTFFKEKFSHKSVNIRLDKLNFENKNEENSLMQCLKLKSKSNVLPMIFLNGMYIGNYNSLSNYEYKKDLDIFFT